MVQEQKPIGKWISILGRYHQAQMAKLLEPYRIGLGQYPFLLAVCAEPGIRQDKLADQLFLNKSSVARAVSSLEGNGYLTRRVAPEDKRAYEIYPTDKALACRYEIVRASRVLTDGMTAGFSEAEKELLGTLMKRIWENIANGQPACPDSPAPPNDEFSHEKRKMKP